MNDPVTILGRVQLIMADDAAALDAVAEQQQRIRLPIALGFTISPRAHPGAIRRWYRWNQPMGHTALDMLVRTRFRQWAPGWDCIEQWTGHTPIHGSRCSRGVEGLGTDTSSCSDGDGETPASTV